ncbi:cytochrome P450 9e2-like [Asbolus verrucosus]|uniref:Cytochrome P450 9e2-like n=1 Tax=Asbolus verrucosus TaxID=1661398 RepID=A0A482W1H7_ASBVE|nr:cytochrome P450 9e2-like [Asbolus verrucosus]
MKRENEGIVHPDLIHLLMEARKGKLKHETSKEEKVEGSRFALFEIEILFYHLRSKFDIIPVQKTIIPMKIEPKQFNLVSENGLVLIMFLFLLVVIVSVCVYYKLVKPCDYWKQKGIAYVPSWPLVGNLGSVVLRKKHLMDVTVDMYKNFHSERFVGYMQFTRHHLLLRDLELIKQIGVKEFSHFTDHAPLIESETDLFLSKSLVTLKGEKWSEMRATLSPAFTSSKMKNMYVLIAECAENFVNNFQTEVEVEAKEFFSKFANDVIATTAFGIQIDSVKEPNNDFFTMGVTLSNFTVWQTTKLVLSQLSKTVADFFGIEILPKHVTGFFRSIIMDNIRKRETEGIVQSLRLWPPGFQTDRLCVKNYLIQPTSPEEKPFLIEKGVAVVIPTMALHRDPQYYPEPTRFDPERFNDANKSKILPGTYLPFAKYWSGRYVTHLSSWPLVGNMGAFVMRKKHFMNVALDIYNNFPNERYVGFMQFTRPALVVRDLDLIKQIGIKEFDHFHDHVTGSTSNDEIMSKALINLSGQDWRQMRATLSPAFTSNKMKNMYHLISECAENFVKHFQGKEQVSVEMKDILSRFANDVIATTAFGIKVDSLRDLNHEFFLMGKRLTTFSFGQTIKLSIILISQTIATKLQIEMLPKATATFFRSIIKNNITKRETEGIVRPDLLHLLMEARKGKLKHETVKDEKGEGFATVEESHIGKNTKQMELTDNHIVAQALLFFFAGFETVSTASSFLAHELAVNPDVQKKLQEEIDAVNEEHEGKIPYEILLSMKYFDQVVCESLRKWPAAFQTDRICTKNYTILPKKAHERVLEIEEGVLMVIPIMALHRDPQYYPEPERFDPERFSEENKDRFVPGTYLPFGLGPRNCIGSRFALLEIKTLFFHLLSKFDIVPVKETKIPFKINPKQFNLTVEDGFNVGFKPRNVRN